MERERERLAVYWWIARCGERYFIASHKPHGLDHRPNFLIGLCFIEICAAAYFCGVLAYSTFLVFKKHSTDKQDVFPFTFRIMNFLSVFQPWMVMPRILEVVLGC